jgi:hypothetical protein
LRLIRPLGLPATHQGTCAATEPGQQAHDESIRSIARTQRLLDQQIVFYLALQVLILFSPYIDIFVT